MKPLLYLLLPLSFLVVGNSNHERTCKNGKYILEQSIKFHDPKGNWQTASLDMVIREPRLTVPDRFSNVRLDVPSRTFSLERNRGDHVSTHLVDENGQAKTLLDGKPETDPELIEKYRLQPERNTNYRGYYEFMYGLPMVLQGDNYQMKEVREVTFNKQKAISIDFELGVPMIASSWRIFFSPEDYSVLGLETLGEKPEEGEYLIFNGSADMKEMNLARFRHWYDKTNDEYRGSDILVSYK
ncbi:MAG: hypothetical protein HEP71_02050 [Roseivirga sp.]|nr:hypothetical protein [Roseivirga sp.]